MEKITEKIMMLTIAALLLGICFLWGMKFTLSRVVVEQVTIMPNRENLLDAIAMVESKGDPFAIGDRGASVGMYQIQKIYVDDINRIIGRGEFVYEDRLDPAKSREMTRIYLSYYGSYWRLRRRPYLEDLARIHNGGPKGYLNPNTVKYWNKVQKEMKW